MHVHISYLFLDPPSSLMAQKKIHACYLYLLRDLDDAGRYSWGTAVLAHMYRALYKGSVLGERSSAGSHGFYSLLQVI
ncbi:hypothetical protein QJS04_geneDACA023519 [Acorus gramineus]|uniref:Aminotransferase-like plant mobile domain-containing protein n=1 Tax=Acorus gramineus TaxID=55184 RepID=A0AAV8ZZG4_ACOGR|nr:hypothetical protein QJS04_geneDACA023519 [Acorus gramineus]